MSARTFFGKREEASLAGIIIILTSINNKLDIISLIFKVYLIWCFKDFKLLLYQPQEGYCYNSDSIYLYDFISSFNLKGRLLDVGSGCGVLGLLVARDNKVQAEGVDKQWAFCQYTQKNAEVNDIEYVMHQSDFLEFQDSRGFDVIISNPPFYHEGSSKSENEMRHTARYNVHLPMSKFFNKVSKLLGNRGYFVFCYDPQQFQEICVELSKARLTIETVQFIHPKVDRKASLVMIQARKGSKSLMKTREPFVTFDKDEFSSNTQEIYKKARTHSIKCTL